MNASHLKVHWCKPIVCLTAATRLRNVAEEEVRQMDCVDVLRVGVPLTHRSTKTTEDNPQICYRNLQPLGLLQLDMMGVLSSQFPYSFLASGSTATKHWCYTGRRAANMLPMY